MLLKVVVCHIIISRYKHVWPFVFQKKTSDITDVIWENKEETYIYDNDKKCNLQRNQ